MAIKKDYNWLSSNKNKQALDNKLGHFKQMTNLNVKNYYDKGSFCSGFVHDNVIIEADNKIFAITDDHIIYVNNNGNWEVYSSESDF